MRSAHPVSRDLYHRVNFLSPYIPSGCGSPQSQTRARKPEEAPGSLRRTLHSRCSSQTYTMPSVLSDSAHLRDQSVESPHLNAQDQQDMKTHPDTKFVKLLPAQIPPRRPVWGFYSLSLLYRCIVKPLLKRFVKQEQRKPREVEVEYWDEKRNIPLEISLYLVGHLRL